MSLRCGLKTEPPVVSISPPQVQGGERNSENGVVQDPGSSEAVGSCGQYWEWSSSGGQLLTDRVLWFLLV